MGAFLFLLRLPLSSPCRSIPAKPAKPASLPTLAAASLILVASPVRGQLVLNEIYYDHPGADAGREFVEILNVSEAPVSLEAVAIEFHNGSDSGWESRWTGSAGRTIEPGGIYLVGGPLVLPAPDAVTELDLQNGPDAVRVTVGGAECDLVAYGDLTDPEYVEGKSAGKVESGCSLARVPDGIDTDNNASDLRPAIPSPGMFNQPRRDASITVCSPTPMGAALWNEGVETIVLEVSNPGLHGIDAGELTVTLRDSTTAAAAEVGRQNNKSAIAASRADAVSFTVPLAGGYHWLEGRVGLAGDERAWNDAVTLVRRVGGPDVLVSEILSSPPDGCPQFVELFNAGPHDVPLAGFKLRDSARSPVTITRAPAAIESGGFVVVTPDASVLQQYFPDLPPERVIEHGGTWPSFNRSGTGAVSDSAVITDSLSIPIDAVGYPPVGSGEGGRSLERVDLYRGLRRHSWVLSCDVRGATPGRPNGRALYDPPVPGTVDVRPRVCATYDGDVITVSVDPSGEPECVRARVFDVEGRPVADLGGAEVFPAVFLWDGRDRNGRLVPPGLYVVVCESFAESGQRMAAERVVVGCGRKGQ